MAFAGFGAWRPAHSLSRKACDYLGEQSAGRYIGAPLISLSEQPDHHEPPVNVARKAAITAS